MQNRWGVIDFSFLFLLIILSGCKTNQDSNLETRKMNNQTIKARFLNNNIIDGKAEFYDSTGKLVNVSNFDHGLKHGVSIDFDNNGTIVDSVSYWYGNQYGYYHHFDSAGNIDYKNYYYYGLPYGPVIFYNDRKINKYLFYDFNREALVLCKYDSSEALDSISYFHMRFIVEDKVENRKKVKGIFAYLPSIPRSNQEFAIGITNKSNGIKELFAITSNTFFIDTLLPSVPAGFNYYISCSVKSKNGVLNKFYIEQFVENR